MIFTWVAIAIALWLLVGMPWWQSRITKRHERERKVNALEWELLRLHAERGREGLEAKLLADLKELRMLSIMRDTETVLRAPDLMAYFTGEEPPNSADLPVRTADPFDDWRLFGLLPPFRERKRLKKK